MKIEIFKLRHQINTLLSNKTVTIRISGNCQTFQYESGHSHPLVKCCVLEIHYSRNIDKLFHHTGSVYNRKQRCFWGINFKINLHIYLFPDLPIWNIENHKFWLAKRCWFKSFRSKYKCRIFFNNFQYQSQYDDTLSLCENKGKMS